MVQLHNRFRSLFDVQEEDIEDLVFIRAGSALGVIVTTMTLITLILMKLIIRKKAMLIVRNAR